MSNKPLVSIIIPTFNRAHLIGETLDSVLAQTYNHWECIVVDDGSTDGTAALLDTYCAKDPRIQYYQRPEDRPKGANACRNYGFEVSTGDYVNWFDSDDLMLPEKLNEQLCVLLEDNDLDYCVDCFDKLVDSKLFKEEVFSKNLEQSINLSNYLKHKVYWGTINFLGKRKIFLKSKFNERLHSGQEYNFFVSILANTTSVKGKFLNKVLNHRRVHEHSIQQIQKEDHLLRLKNKFAVYWVTFDSYKVNLDIDDRLFLFKNTCVYYHKLLIYGVKALSFNRMFFEASKLLGIFKALQIITIMIGSKLTKKGDVVGSRLIHKIL